MDEISFQLTLELAKSKKVREETEERCAEELGAMLERLDLDIEDEKKARDEGTSRLY